IRMQKSCRMSSECPWSSDDQSNRINIWGKSLLADAEENDLPFCNGRFGKDIGT
ncbi:hypothetical protein QYM36_004146, partial [Artemia franciscana]